LLLDQLERSLQYSVIAARMTTAIAEVAVRVVQCPSPLDKWKPVREVMSWILLVGAALNLAGATQFLIVERHAADGELMLFKWFTAGAAAVFACLYLFLYWHTGYVQPFLFFGAALKTWAFVIALVLFLRRQVSGRRFVEFGVTNGLVAVGFWTYLATM